MFLLVVMDNSLFLNAPKWTDHFRTWLNGEGYYIKRERVRTLNFNSEIGFSISSVKIFFIVSERDGLSGHCDFP